MFDNLIDFQKQFSTELKCVRYLEKIRYGKSQFVLVVDVIARHTNSKKLDYMPVGSVIVNLA